MNTILRLLAHPLVVELIIGIISVVATVVSLVRQRRAAEATA